MTILSSTPFPENVIRSLFVTLADRGYLKYTFVALNHGVALSVMHYFIILFYIKSKICKI